MRPVARTLPLHILTLALAFGASSPGDARAAGRGGDERLIELVRDLEEQRRSLHVPGLAIAVVQGDRVVLAQGLGRADVENGKPVTPLTLFAIGSSTKAFTTTLISMLAEERRLSWDAPVTDYLPWFDLRVDVPEGEDATVTLTDLVSHRTGFAHMGPLWAGGQVERARFLRTATRAEAFAPLRSGFHYNNVMFVAAAEAAARTTGRSWEQLMRRRLLRPLAMRSSTLSVDRARRSSRLAKGYRWDEESGEFVHVPMREISQVGPAGSINSNVVDMANWLRFMLARGELDGKRLLSEESVLANWQPQTQIAPGVAYARGWFVREWQGHAVVEHGGNIDGFAAQVTLFPEDDLGYVLLANVTATPLQQLSIDVVGSALLAEEAPSAAATSEEPFNRYLGEYVADFGPFDDARFTVLVQGGKLAVDVPGQTVYELEPPDADGKRTFSLTDRIAVSFETNDDGAVVLMKMYQSGLTFELPRAGTEAEAEAVSPEALAAFRPYLGSYRSASLQADVEALVENGRLALDIPGQMVFELEAPDASGRRAFRVAPVIAAEFVEDAGRITALRLFRNGALQEAMPRNAGPAPSREVSIEELHRRRRADRLGAALAAIGPTRMAGRLRFVHSGLEGRVVERIDGASRRRSETDLGPYGHTVTVVRGDTGATRTAGGEPSVLEGVLLRQFRLEHPLALCGDWRLFFDEAEVMRSSTLDGRAVHVVKLRAAGVPPWTVHVDAETGDVLQAKATTVLPGGVGELATTTRYSDFRDVSGLRIPFRVVTDGGDALGRVELDVTSVEPGTTFPANVFELEGAGR